jgi:DNA (cytosine-5)-methyltransferase 1
MHGLASAPNATMRLELGEVQAREVHREIGRREEELVAELHQRIVTSKERRAYGRGKGAPRLRVTAELSRTLSCLVRGRFTSIEICAGAGGQALGLEQAGFVHRALVELDPHACATLRVNRPYWNTIQDDVTRWRATHFRGRIDLLAGGVPCPPFSKAGKQLGAGDERDLFPAAIRLVRECQPDAVMLENVRGLLDPSFESYRDEIDDQLRAEGYETFWRLHHASDYGVPQLRPRTILVAMRGKAARHFRWPTPSAASAPTVGEVLAEMMASRGWEGAAAWAARANKIAPTLVGGSMKHGGPDLGPSRARAEWLKLGVNGKLVTDEPPPPGFVGDPCLTVRMAAALQAFPSEWRFMGRKTHAYRQVGNAFPPPVAKAVGQRIAVALRAARTEKRPSAGSALAA